MKTSFILLLVLLKDVKSNLQKCYTHILLSTKKHASEIVA